MVANKRCFRQTSGLDDEMASTWSTTRRSNKRDTTQLKTPTMLDNPTHRTAQYPSNRPPVMMVIVDTEEEFDWDKPFARSNTATTNIGKQNLTESIFAEYGVIPTYVIDYPVATQSWALTILRGLLEVRKCEIGTHLHPWVNPPFEEDITTKNSYPGNLPAELEFRKLEALTQAVEMNLGLRPTVYKAGRYGVGPATANSLERLGYEIDCSVVPHTSFEESEGPNFQNAPDQPYWFGNGRMLEIPLTTNFVGIGWALGPLLYPIVTRRTFRRCHMPGLLARSGILERITLTPEGVDHAAHLRLIKALLDRGHRIFSLTYHSPSLGLGHTPYVRTGEDLQRLLERIRGILHFFKFECKGEFITPTRLRAVLAEG